MSQTEAGFKVSDIESREGSSFPEDGEENEKWNRALRRAASRTQTAQRVQPGLFFQAWVSGADLEKPGRSGLQQRGLCYAARLSLVI